MAQRQTPRDAAEALRTAVDRTVAATVGQAGVTRERAQELVEEVAQAAGKVRDVLEDLRVATKDDLRDISGRLSKIEKRLDALEKSASAAKKPAAKKPAAKKQARSKSGK